MLSEVFKCLFNTEMDLIVLTLRIINIFLAVVTFCPIRKIKISSKSVYDDVKNYNFLFILNYEPKVVVKIQNWNGYKTCPIWFCMGEFS